MLFANDLNESDDGGQKGAWPDTAAVHIDTKTQGDEVSRAVADHASDHRIEVALATVTQASEIQIELSRHRGWPCQNWRGGFTAMGNGRTVSRPFRTLVVIRQKSSLRINSQF